MNVTPTPNPHHGIEAVSWDMGYADCRTYGSPRARDFQEAYGQGVKAAEADAVIDCDRDAWTGETCGWSGPRREAGHDDGGNIIYCPKCEWLLEMTS